MEKAEGFPLEKAKKVVGPASKGGPISDFLMPPRKDKSILSVRAPPSPFSHPDALNCMDGGAQMSPRFA